MSQIRIVGNKIAVTFSNTSNAEMPGMTGLMSQASWDNPDLIPAMNKLFHIKGKERLIAVEVGPDGIKALIEYNK